jgi:hypothetical protein
MRLFQYCQFYRYRNLVSQVFRAGQFGIDVGVSTTFERQILLPQNGRNLIDGSHVISLQYQYFLGDNFFADIIADICNFGSFAIDW